MNPIATIHFVALIMITVSKDKNLRLKLLE
jgi:hypothetical protein